MKLKTCLGALLALSFCYADVRLPSVIGDHMLLQRDVPVRIFGKGRPWERSRCLSVGRMSDDNRRPGPMGSVARAHETGSAAEMTIREPMKSRSRMSW